MKIKKNGKVVNLTESDLQKIVKKVISEGKVSYTDGKGKEHSLVSIKDVARLEKELGMDKFELFKKLGSALNQFDERQAFPELLALVMKD